MKKKKLTTFIIVLIIAILSTVNFLRPHYSIDTIEFMANGFESYINSKFLVDGRIFSVLLLKLVIEQPMEYVIPITYIIGILISCLTVMYLSEIIRKNKQSNNIIIPTIISYLTIFNFMYIDTFQFLEFPIIAISLLLYIISANIIINEKKGNFIKSIILMIIAMFCYQGTVIAFIVTAFVLSIIKNGKINRNLIINMLKVIGLLILSIGINYIFTVFVGETQRLDFNIIENLKNAIISLYLMIFNSGTQYPEFLQLIFVMLIIICCIKHKIKILNIIFIYLICIFCPIIILGVTTDNLIGNFGRVLFSIGSLIGYIMMYLWCTSDIIEKSRFMKLIIFIYSLTILITYTQYTYFYMKGQDIDKNIITKIDCIIQEYEENTGNKINKYAYKVEGNSKIWSSRDILNKEYTNEIYTIIVNGRRTSEMINEKLFEIYTERQIQITVFEDEVYEKYFKEKQLDKFNEERFVFIEDTVYMIF